MNTQKHSLMIVDLSGYTKFLTSVNLEHALDEITEILKFLIKAIENKNLTLNKIQGDALFFYSETLSKKQLIEIAKKTNNEFKKIIKKESVKHSHCGDKFCDNIHNFEIKFIINEGIIGIHQIGKYKELVGKPVIEIHRMLKNKIKSDSYIAVIDKKGKYKEKYKYLGEIKYHKILLKPERKLLNKFIKKFNFKI